MADLGRAMISKIINDGDMVTSLGAGIQSHWFEDTEAREVHQWMVEYFNRYSAAPTHRALRRQFPNYKILSTVEPYAYYIDLFREQRRRSILVDSLVDADTALKEDDHKRAEEAFSGGLVRLGKEVSSLSDENAVTKLKDRYESYRERCRNKGKITGVRTGFATLDMATSGYHPQQFVVLGGTAKQGKSFILMKSAIAAQEQGKKVLFLSFEMSAFEQLCRYDGITCGVNAMHLQVGELSFSERKKLRMGMQNRKGMRSFIISSDISATTTISGLAGKIEQHQPDIIFIDGAYLMESEGGELPQSSQAYTAISRGLKRLAQRIDRPLIVTVQALPSKMDKKEQAVTMHSLGWTSAWSQDADLILGAERVSDSTMLKLRVVAGRNVAPQEIAVAVNWQESLIEEIDLPDEDE
jgi:replicative DNA helicase